MYPNTVIGNAQSSLEYVPYFYAAGRFLWYGQPRRAVRGDVRYAPAARYDFTSDLIQRDGYPVPQTVEDVIRKGYLAIPKSDPETALISDRKHTARLGLDDVIDQIRKRYELYDRNIYELEWAKCSVLNSLHQHEAYHGPANSRVEYSVNKRLDKLYADQREERLTLWQDISRLRLQLPENAQLYLSAYRKASILEEDKGDAS